MPDLSFEIINAEVPAYAAVPTLTFKLRVTNALAGERVHSVSLRSQVQIAVTRRRYSPEAQGRLLELFGEPKRWGDTLRALLWTNTSSVIPRFDGSLVTDLPITCTYDFEVASTKYFDALEDGEIPLVFLFSGTIFYEGDEGNLQIAQIPWSKESFYRLPVATWKEMIARYYPNNAWIRLQKDVFDQLYQYKATQGLPTWEEVITRLLQASSQSTNSLRATAKPTNGLRGQADDEEVDP
jgi:hypothetical protein